DGLLVLHALKTGAFGVGAEDEAVELQRLIFRSFLRIDHEEHLLFGTVLGISAGGDVGQALGIRAEAHAFADHPAILLLLLIIENHHSLVVFRAANVAQVQTIWTEQRPAALLVMLTLLA